MALPGSSCLSHLRSIVGSIEWWRLNPCAEILALQPGSDDPLEFVAAACSCDRDLAMIYAPLGGRIEIRPDFLATGLEAINFNPADGIKLWSQPLGGGSLSLDLGAGGDRLLLIRPLGDRKRT